MTTAGENQSHTNSGRHPTSRLGSRADRSGNGLDHAAWSCAWRRSATRVRLL